MCIQHLRSGFTEKGAHPVVVLPRFSTKGFTLSKVNQVATEIKKASMLRIRNEISKLAFELMGERVVIQDGDLVATDEEAAKVLAGIFKKKKNGYILPIH